MAGDGDGPNPLDQLIDLLVYAPVGLLYEHEEVLPKLIRRGKSQVQLARLFGQMAVSRGQRTAEDSVGDAVTIAASILSRAVTELAGAIGLTPDQKQKQPARPAAQAPELEEVAVDEHAVDEPAGEAHAGEPLPIGAYDELKAREIIPLLDQLTASQRQRIRHHELANRGRKTVLAKLDRLET